MGAIRVCGLRLDPDLGVQPKSGKKNYLRLTAEKIHAFEAFTEN